MTRLRLDGLEADNLLAFLALLGLLRSLEIARPNWRPRVCWDVDHPPLRPILQVVGEATAEEVSAAAADGVAQLARDHDFGEREDLNYNGTEAGVLLSQAARAATVRDRRRADLLAGLMSDGAIKDGKGPEQPPIDPTPLCLLFGQGHQHFLQRLAAVPAEPAAPPRGRGQKAVALTAAECLAEALFAPWHRNDPTFSFRWDPEEDVRYALMAGDPTDAAYKRYTQHGANRLASVGLAALTLVPESRAGRVRPAILGGASGADGFSFAWPIWREPATLAAIRTLLGHPSLRRPGALEAVGVERVFVARRISVGKFMNFTRGSVLGEG
jgi:hypothetical protein